MPYLQNVSIFCRGEKICQIENLPPMSFKGYLPRKDSGCALLASCDNAMETNLTLLEVDKHLKAFSPKAFLAHTKV